MRKPKISEFYDETTNTYDYDEYEAVMGDYADEMRDDVIEREWDKQTEKDENNE